MKCPYCNSSNTYPEIVHPAFATEVWECRECEGSFEVRPGIRLVVFPSQEHLQAFEPSIDVSAEVLD